VRIKHLSVLLVTSLLSLAASSVSAESSQSPEMSFSCQLKEGVPTTVAQETDGNKSVSVFHWKEEALPHSVDAKQLCERVSAKLEDYAAQGYDLSTLGFTSSEMAGLPSICAAGESGDCSVVLFTLSPTEKPIDAANKVLTAILDKDLQGNQLALASTRGVQSITYQVNIWSLLGFQKLIK
jgi:hypothetical protein